MNLRQIGIVRSDVRQRKAMPPLGVPAAVEIFQEFAAAMHRMTKHSHVWVLAWLDARERDVLQVTPRGVTDRGPESLHGVFAVRSPARPNPVGLTACRVRRIDGLRIDVDRLDFLDGTPVLDLKPYFVSRDAILAANNAPIGKPVSRELMRASLALQAENFHGEMCAGLALGVRLIEHYRDRFYGLGEPEQWRVAAPLGRACLIDAIMGMTRVTPGRGTLAFHDRDAVRIGDVEYELTVDRDAQASEMWNASDDSLFRLVWP